MHVCRYHVREAREGMHWCSHTTKRAWERNCRECVCCFRAAEAVERNKKASRVCGERRRLQSNAELFNSQQSSSNVFLLGVSTAADAVQLSLEERIAEETGFWSDYQKFTIFQAACIKAAKTSGQSKQAKA